MALTLITPTPEVAFDVLKFMRTNVEHRSMLKDMLDADLEVWFTLTPDDQSRLFDRHRRRFEMACPSLAKSLPLSKTSKGVSGTKSKFPRVGTVQRDIFG